MSLSWCLLGSYLPLMIIRKEVNRLGVLQVKNL